MRIDALVEGDSDELMANKLILHSGHEMGDCFGKRGIHYITNKLRGFAVRARYGSPLLVLIDFMDTHIPCERDLVRTLLANRPPRCLVRGVVRELESWLLADREAVADFLGISDKRLPLEPEKLDDPKRTFINLARKCRKRSRREAIVPAEGISASVGFGYQAEVAVLLRQFWSPDRARVAAPSLDRCLQRLQQMN